LPKTSKKKTTRKKAKTKSSKKKSSKSSEPTPADRLRQLANKVSALAARDYDANVITLIVTSDFRNVQGARGNALAKIDEEIDVESYSREIVALYGGLLAVLYSSVAAEASEHELDGTGLLSAVQNQAISYLSNK
jgi:hypothetical protein